MADLKTQEEEIDTGELLYMLTSTHTIGLFITHLKISPHMLPSFPIY